METAEKNYQRRALSETRFETREADDGNKYIEGYFAVFDSPYHIFENAFETVARGAFTDQLTADVRALINHDTRLVIGRTTADTLRLREDDTGLWGSILINPNDQDALNAWERVRRGDVSQCSFGFDILDEETEYLDNGQVHWTIKRVKLWEVSVCTFPAYEDTGVTARSRDLAEIQERRKSEVWKATMLKKLKGETQNGTESPDAAEGDH